MNRAELIVSMAEKSKLNKKDSEKGLNGFIKSIEEALANGEKVSLVGFGTFEVRERAARKGRNPRNPDEIIDIKASKSPVFRAGKSLKEVINAQ